MIAFVKWNLAPSQMRDVTLHQPDVTSDLVAIVVLFKLITKIISETFVVELTLGV